MTEETDDDLHDPGNDPDADDRADRRAADPCDGGRIPLERCPVCDQEWTAEELAAAAVGHFGRPLEELTSEALSLAHEQIIDVRLASGKIGVDIVEAAIVAELERRPIPGLKRREHLACAHGRVSCTSCNGHDFCAHLWTKCRCAEGEPITTRWET